MNGEEAMNLLTITPLAAMFWITVIVYFRRADAGDRFTERFTPCAVDVAAIEATLPRMAGDHRPTPNAAPAPALSIVDKLDAARARLAVSA